MDRLSPEILSLIVDEYYADLQSEPCAELVAEPPPYTISRDWQFAVEARTLAHIEFRSTELLTFTSIFSDPRRQALLRRITFDISLPSPFYSPWYHASNVTAFCDAVKSLWGLLAQWERDTAAHHNVAWPSLEITVSLNWGDISEKDLNRQINAAGPWLVSRHLQLALKSLDGLPQVRRVTSFNIGTELHPTIMCRLACSFPSLESLDLEFEDAAMKRRKRRQKFRVALAEGLRQLRERLPNLKKLRLRREQGWDPVNHSFECQDFEDAEGVDVLCEAIRQLAEVGRLTHLETCNILVSPDFFRDRRRASVDKPALAWSGMRTLIIRDHILSPSGKWYYSGDPAAVKPGVVYSHPEQGSSENAWTEDEANSDISDEYGDHLQRDALVNGASPRHEWRTRPDPETFDPLVADMADAVLHRMPRLKSLCLDIGEELSNQVRITIQCTASGYHFVENIGNQNTNQEEIARRIWKVWVGENTTWDIPMTTRQLWREWVGDWGKVIKSTYLTSNPVDKSLDIYGVESPLIGLMH